MTLRAFNPLFSGKSPNNSAVTLYVRHGGWGPTPGTAEARKMGCICPGKVGDKDRWGAAGYTERSDCLHHGDNARSSNHAAVREERRRLFERLDDEDGRQCDG